VFSCPSAAESRLNRPCVWTRIETDQWEQPETFENFGAESAGIRLLGGFQRAVGDGDWSLAAAVGYHQSDLSVDLARAATEGQGFTAGLGLQRRSDDGLTLGVSVSGGASWFETSRAVNVFTPGIGRSEFETGYLQTRFDASQLLRAGPLFAKPGMGLSVTALHHGGLREDGLDGLGVDAESDTTVIAALHPDLSFGAIFNEAGDRPMVLTLSAGGRFSSDDELTLPVRLIGAGAGAGAAEMAAPYDANTLRLGGELRVIGDARMNLSIGYVWEGGEATERKRGGLDFRFKF